MSIRLGGGGSRDIASKLVLGIKVCCIFPESFSQFEYTEVLQTACCRLD